nr:RNA-directed DNA polymerase, eukaryota, reverse transcriptase zinc-binding domain protein [Tanacetum cinerariifolium]
GSLISLDGDMPNVLSPDLREFIERPLSNDEIKRVVWDCGEDRTPGPDGYTFKFFTTFWDVIHADVYRFVREFFHTVVFPKGFNSSFIALIPKISNARNAKSSVLVNGSPTQEFDLNRGLRQGDPLS